MARCMSMRITTGPVGLPGVPSSRKSGMRNSAVTSAASRVSSHFGREFSLVTAVHVAVAPAIPSTVSRA
ncbi:MAG: hypothetical protein QOG28_5404 [Trebonia sp.]|nr:hypothetical protein [Trebonia sp.]